MGKNRVRRLRVPMLSGGVNASTDPTMIEDNELSSASNVRWKNGALSKRRALRAVGTAPFVALLQTTDKGKTAESDGIVRHPIDIDGTLCTIVHSGVRYGSVSSGAEVHEQVDVVSLDGEVLGTYQTSSPHVQNAAFAPCDKEKYGCSFLMYRGNVVYKPDDASGTMQPVPEDELYAPLVMVNGKSIGVATGTTNPERAVNGVMFEGFNLLTRRYRARFTTENGTVAERFCMPTALQSGSVVRIDCATPHGDVSVQTKVGGEGTEFKVNATTHTLSADIDGTVIVTPPFPKSLVSDNLTVTAVSAQSSSDSTAEATLAAWFGGTQNKLGGTRLFLSGFTKDKAKVMWSDVGNPLYFPENNYMYVGDLSQRVTALEKQSSMLVVFKERELFYTTYVQGSIEAEEVSQGLNVDVTVSQAYFPLTQLSPYIGCDAPGSIAVCRDRLVWMCRDGRVYTLVEGSVYSERNVREIGQKVHPLMMAHTNKERTAASAMDHDGQYVLLIGNTAYSFDYSESGFAHLTSYSSGEKAAQRIAWFVHAFPFDSRETVRLVSDGAYRAIAVSTQSLSRFPYVRMLYLVTDAEKDSHAAITPGTDAEGIIDHVNTVVTDSAITASLTTKAYDFGDMASFKRVEALFLAAKGDDLTLRFQADGKTATAFRSVTCDGHSGRMVLPGVKRCRTFQMTVETTDPFTLIGLRLQYAPFGTVR
ncbi:MAG: hypothetical protein IJB27_01545 [Clostridia bacterium]|nr:hypothetical protein [Clostridia bacterium]